MDPRLEEACHTGNLGMLHNLLKEDKLLLHNLSSITASSDHNPLHIAASLGHTDLANELIIRNPHLASELNPRGFSALHLASANGHLETVKLLISKVGSHLCFLKDKDGRLPIHTVAMKGRINILEELIKVCPESTRVLTYQNESILHLAILSNSFETLEFLVKKLEVDDDFNELLNLQDDKGNTILHHAVARRQLQSVKLLLNREGIEVINARNHIGLTALDVLLESPSEHGDLALGELIRAAGGNTSQDHLVNHHQTPIQYEASPLVDDFMASPPKQSNVRKRSKKRPTIEDTYTPGTLMIVATLIATVTFQAGLNPPGGFTQANDPVTNSSSTAGLPVLGSNLNLFLVFDVIGLSASLIIILLLICLMPRKKRKMMMILIWVMWVAVFFTGLAFTAALYNIFPHNTLCKVLVIVWVWVLRGFILLVCFLFCKYLLRRVGWCKKKEGEDQESSEDVAPMGVLLFFKRVVVILVILVFVSVVWVFNVLFFLAYDLNKFF
ncbi:26S proteasome regulatory complex subunit PSMD10 protein [Dioscorea alata]|uniref:26S proteasome regulatory complex subunit PSMD10 protein n=1 Tax=Dioscorea alata TaxID=55571 RepID=A0ACB7WSY3_DIOAL|nr:26S proteasome regulatory complex subunit PSMD10 protein [Dioscorea alata]